VLGSFAGLLNSDTTAALKYIMPELLVVREFRRRCMHALGDKPHPCTVYFNQKAMSADGKNLEEYVPPVEGD
jgi:hypothetical protein